jgi:hypothetical protein
MALGPGRYDKECRELLKNTRADIAMLIVLNGDKGHGVSLAGNYIKLEGMKQIPGFLRMLADRIEQGPPY